MSILKYLQESLNESNRITVYHGDSHGLDVINGNYKPMNLPNSNQQEGPGIYFSLHASTAKGYGEHVVSTTIDPNKFIPSRDLVEDHLSQETVAKMMHEIYKEDEDFWYILTDYGVYVTEPEEVEDHHWYELADMMMTEEVRNFIITLVDSSNVKSGVSNFVKHSGYYGTYNKIPKNKYAEADTWFAVMYNDDKLTKVS